MDYLLAHDVGTSGNKAALVTPDGRIVATAYEPYLTRYPRPLWAEQDPEEWWRAVANTTRQAMEASDASPGQILGLCFSTQMVNAIPLDAQARPLMRAISWLDGRAGEEAHIIMRKLGGPTLFAMIAGVAITGKDLLAKYLWLKRNEPDIYARSAAIVDASSYLLHRATGRLVYDWGTASVTGLFNLKTKVWDTTLIRLFGFDEKKFPELVQSHERIGGLTAEAAAYLGLTEGTPVFGGAGDAMTAAVGSGAVGEGDGHLCLGTSGFVGIVTSRRVTGKRGIVSIQSADPNKLMLIAETETAGACLKWAAKELYCADADSATYQRMDGEVAGTAPGAGGLIFTPWMYGERCPVADETVRASFINLGSNHTRPQMARAIYEGVAYNMRWILEDIAELYGFRPNPLRVIGGGARGLPWLRIIADVTGRTLESVPSPQEASAVGAALIAAVGLGTYPNIESIKSLVPAGHVVKPDAAPRATYDELYAAYRQVYHSLRGLYRTLNRSH
jgi:xylulokinase